MDWGLCVLIGAVGALPVLAFGWLGLSAYKQLKKDTES